MSQPFAWGAWPAWEPDDSEDVTAFFADIVQPEERVYFAGDIASLWAGWMEGAFASAHTAIAEIDARSRGEKS
jgi:monoamine oxidase